MLSPAPNMILCSRVGSKCNNILAWHHYNNIAVTTTNAGTNASLWMTFVVPNVIIMIALIQVAAPNAYFSFDFILVTAPNAFPDSLFINLLCAHVVFERSTDREWHNPSGTSSDGRDDSLEQNCLGVGNSKTGRTLRQQLTIIYWNVFV